MLGRNQIDGFEQDAALELPQSYAKQSTYSKRNLKQNMAEL